MSGLIDILLINVVNGVLWGLIIGVSSLGLTELWGVMKVVNIAQGETLLLGAYIVIWAYTTLALSPLIGIWVALAIGIAAGAIIYFLLLHKLIGKVEVMTLKTEMSTLLIMFALSIILSNSYYYWIGAEPKGLGTWKIFESTYYYIGSLRLRTNEIFAATFAIILTLVMYLFLSKTITGKAIRAVMQDAQAASLVGINPVKIKLLTSILGIGITVFTGFLILLHEASITPETAVKYAPIAFAVVVLGGLGNELGTLIGGIIIGFVYGLTKVIISSINPAILSDPFALSTAFMILVLTLLLKPEGLFGRG